MYGHHLWGPPLDNAEAVVGAFGAMQAQEVTLVAFVVVRIGLAEIARPGYVSPLVYSSHDLWIDYAAANPAAWWLDHPSYYDASGRLLATVALLDTSTAQLRGPAGDRFLTFQSIESAILIGLAPVLIGFAIYWVTRRVS